MTRAFVAGATGYTGRAVVRVLTERKIDTIAHVRPDSSRLAEWRDRFAALGARTDTTAWTAQAMRETMANQRPDVIFALLGTTRARGRRAASGAPETYETIDYGLTKLLIDAAAAAGQPRFVYLSSIGVSARSKGAYMSARWRAEEALRASQLPFTIVRPSFITGPDRDERRVGERVGAAVGDTALFVAGLLGARAVQQRYRSISNTDLAEALVDLALSADGENAVIEADKLSRSAG